MGLIRGYVGFKGRKIEDLAILKTADLGKLDLYTAQASERNGITYKRPIVFFDGESDLKSADIILTSRKLLGLDDKIKDCDLSAGNDGDWIFPKKWESLEGNYMGIRVMPELFKKKDDPYRAEEAAYSFANSKEYTNVMVRGVEKEGNKQKYCIDLITTLGDLDRLQARIASELTGKINFLGNEFTKIPNLKRLR